VSSGGRETSCHCHGPHGNLAPSYILLMIQEYRNSYGRIWRLMQELSVFLSIITQARCCRKGLFDLISQSNSNRQPEMDRTSQSHAGDLESQTCEQRSGIVKKGGDTVSTEAVATRRHAGTHLPATWWKTRTANNNLALAA